MIDFQAVVETYNPWWVENNDFLTSIPSFHRPVFLSLIEDLKTIPQILSITGPRRIGKSTLLYQMIRRLLEEGVQRDNIIYYSFDDPVLTSRHTSADLLIEWIMKRARRRRESGLTYLFFDEIQRLERWELYIKKYYDLKYPIRVIISGSASSPIFKKTRESLLGRVKDFHLLPFSFREYLMYSLGDKPSLLSELNTLHESGQAVEGMLAEAPGVDHESVDLSMPGLELRTIMDESIKMFFLQGGFPEVWTLPNWVAKQDYLFDNQVKKVIYEDIVLAAEFRKPELLKRFYLSLLEMPGREINVQAVAKETEVKAAQIEKYLPLLEMTDLIYHISKFRASPLRVRKGMMKFYLVDLALRNAVMRLSETLLTDTQTLGFYAENLVFLALRKWRGTIQMDYFRDRTGEVDFIVHVSPGSFIPVEVKYQNAISADDLHCARRFTERYKVASNPIVVTKRWADFGSRDGAFMLPLPLFLTLFD